MGKSLSSDLRSRILSAVAGGRSCRAVAAQFAVAPSTVIRLVRHVDRTGEEKPVKQGRPFGFGKLAPHMETIIARVEEQPDITLPELAAVLKEERDLSVHPGHLSKVLCKAGFSYKKNAAGGRARTRRYPHSPS